MGQLSYSSTILQANSSFGGPVASKTSIHLLLGQRKKEQK
jgi:hypothetical protein